MKREMTYLRNRGLKYRMAWLAVWMGFVWPVFGIGGPAGTLDPTFDIKTGFLQPDGWSSGQEIRALAVQPDGQLMVAGDFKHFQGKACTLMARIRLDGSLDPSFLPAIEGQSVTAMLAMDDGGFLIGGRFSRINGQACPGLARLRGDGSVDPQFVPQSNFNDVQALARQSDGKILVCLSNQVVRLLPGGNLDAAFPVQTVSPWLSSLVVQPDDKILINGLIRLHPEGSPDLFYHCAVTNIYEIRAVLVLPDGKILLGGLFPENTQGRLVPYASLKCLNPDGSLAAAFKQDTSARIGLHYEGDVRCLARQPDGKILAGGMFIEVNGRYHPGVFRIHPDGSLDEDFQTELEVYGYGENDQYISAMAVSGDRLYVSGLMTKINGLARADLASLFLTSQRAPALIAWKSASSMGAESAGRVDIQVLRQGNPYQEVGVHFTTGSWWGDSAVPQEDFPPQNGLLMFGPGETNKTISLPLFTDHRVEASEQFAVILDQPTGYAVLGHPQTMVVTLLDQESQDMPGSVDPTFQAVFEVENAYPGVQGILCLTNGTLLVRGIFQWSDITQYRLFTRLLPEGQPDPAFATQLDGDVLDFAADGAGQVIYIGGNFTRVNGEPRPSLARLNGSGALDASFQVQLDGMVGRLVLTPGGQLIIFGNFTTVDGVACTRLARLNADGTLDAAFTAETAPRWTGYWMQPGELPQLVLQSDGKLLLAGCGPDSSYGLKQNLMRLNPDGSLDGTFLQENVADLTYVHTALLQPDGRILVGGYCGEWINKNPSLVRLQPDGTLDNSFHSDYQGSVHGLVRQPDGKILVAGVINSGLNPGHRSVARLFPDGKLEVSFFVGAVDDYFVDALALQADGKVLIGGRFSEVNHYPLPYLARLKGDAFIETNRLPGAVTLATPYLRVAKGADAVSVQVQRIWGNQGLIEVDYVTEDGSAHAGIEYQAQTGRVRFNDGDLTPQNIAIPLLNPQAPTAGGAFAVRFLSPTNGAIIGPNTATTIDIASTSSIVRFNLDNTEVHEDKGPLRVLVSCDGVHGQEITVQYRTVDGTAKAGEDYEAQAGTVQFGPNAGHSQIIQIPIHNDTLPENHETFQVQLVAVTGPALLFDHTNLDVTILEDDDHYYDTGNVDTHFRPWPGAIGDVYAVGLHEGNKILVGGQFNQFNGETHSALVQLEWNGLLDPYFDPLLENESSPSAIVDALEVQPDQRIVVAGRFNRANGNVCSGLVRLNAAGWLDPTFDAGQGLQGGDHNQVTALVLQPDGKILLAGEFRQVNRVPRSGVARLLANGEVDMTFDPGLGLGGGNPSWGLALALQPDGKIFIGGNFTTFNGQPSPSLARLQANGSLDASFHPELDGAVRALVVEPDQQILVAGAFSHSHGQSARNLARLNPDGSLNNSLQSGSGLGGAGVTVHTMVRLADGKILLGGSFATYNGQPCRAIVRLYPDGGLDAQFNTGALMGDEDAMVHSIAVQENGQVVIGGRFGLVRGITYGGVARLNGEGAITFLPALCHREPWSHFHLSLSAIPGLPFFLEASTNLVDWRILFTNAVSYDRYDWTDTNAAQYPAFYYRAQSIK